LTALLRLVEEFLRQLKALIYGWIEIVLTTRNWWSVLVVYSGIRSTTNVVFRKGATIRFSRQTRAFYIALRKLVLCGVTPVNESDKLLLVQLPSGIRLLIRHIHGDLVTVREVFLDRAYYLPDLEGKVVVDVGAGIGDSSIYFAQSGAEVYAFEPLLESYKLARRNIELNGLADKIHLYNRAVSGSHGFITLRTVVGEPERSTTSSFDAGFVDAGSVETITLGEIIDQNGLNRIDVLKLDCEGCEFEVIRPENEQALALVHRILIEYHRDPRTICIFLRRMGFATTMKKMTSHLRAREGPIRPDQGWIYAERTEVPVIV